MTLSLVFSGNKLTHDDDGRSGRREEYVGFSSSPAILLSCVYHHLASHVKTRHSQADHQKRSDSVRGKLVRDVPASWDEPCAE